MTVEFTQEPITTSGTYLWKWNTGILELVFIYEKNHVFYIADYPNSYGVLPLDDYQFKGSLWAFIEENKTE